jgi:hypothetical protein
MPETLPEHESPSIGELNEGSLHAALKDWVARPGDPMEVQVGRYVVDVVQDGLLIEVQTRSLSSIRAKLQDLCTGHRVRLVYPVIGEKLLVRLDPDTGQELGRRRSPLKGNWLHLFDELVYAPLLLEHPRFELQAVLVAVDEWRCADGKGSWRNRGVSIVDRRLREVRDARLFRCGADLAGLLPEELAAPFTHRELARASGVRLPTAQRASYCLRKLGILQAVGRRGRAMLVAPTQ